MSPKNIPWAELVRRIGSKRQTLTPFLGAGISQPPIPEAAKLAGMLASKEPKFPFLRYEDLMQVAQHMATLVDGDTPKAAVAELIKEHGYPDLNDESQPHVILASLPIPVYLTTNYDDFMEKALQKKKRNPFTEVCRWNSELRRQPSYLMDNEPSADNPVVFHLHGHIKNPNSFVLTEDDYLDFMVNVRRYEGTPSDSDAQVLPPKIQELLSTTSLLFIGYGLRDWNLRLLLRALVKSADVSTIKIGVSVQLEPDDEVVDEIGKAAAIEYLEKYFEGLNIRVFWGSAQEFLAKLKTHWDARPVAAAGR